MLRRLAIYLPSLMSRYSIQMMLVALPWILQSRNLSMLTISVTIGFFYAGSLLAALVASQVAGRIRVRQTLQIVILLQGIFSAAALFTSNLALLSLVRFLQGVSVGALRPLSQIWLLEVAGDETPEQRATTAAHSQVVVSLGMAAGSFLGSLAPQATNALLYGVLVCMLPSVIVMFLLPKSNESTPRAPQQAAPTTNLTAALRWMAAHPTSARAILIYLLSLMVLKIWFVGLPFYIREETVKVAGPGILIALSTALAIHPLAFSFGQWLMGFVTERLPRKSSTSLFLLALATALQAVLTWSAILTANPWVIGGLIVIGGGLIPAAIYPILSLINMRDLHDSSPVLRRQVMIVLALAADVGQLMGTALLGLSPVTGVPMEVMVVPLVLVLLLQVWDMLRGEVGGGSVLIHKHQYRSRRAWR